MLGISLAGSMPPDSGNSALVSLAKAAKLVYQTATGKADPSEESLNSIARMIAARARVFASGARDSDTPALVMPDEVFEGQFEGGGEAITFRDGRPTLTGLCLRRSEVGRVMAEISALYKSSAED